MACVLVLQIIMPPKKMKTSTAVAKDPSDNALDESSVAPAPPEDAPTEGDPNTQGMTDPLLSPSVFYGLLVLYASMVGCGGAIPVAVTMVPPLGSWQRARRGGGGCLCVRSMTTGPVTVD